MRFIKIQIIFLAAVLFSFSAIAGTDKDLFSCVAGEWEIAENERIKTGHIIFDGKGRYEMHENCQDGTGVAIKGEYRIYQDSEPARIDLCLQDCGNPGSEWTTRFGIIRMKSDDEIEIFTSPDGNYPDDFPGDNTSEYSMMLRRKK